MNKKILGLVLASTGFMVASGAQASFTIDNFTEPTAGVHNALINQPTVTLGITATSSDFSLERGLELTGAGSAASNVAVGFVGRLGISASSGSNLLSTSSYTSKDGGTNFEFTELSGDGLFDTFAIDLVTWDRDQEVTLRVLLNESLVNESMAFNTFNTGAANTVPGANTQTIEFAYSDFGDLTNVQSISFIFETENAMDISFDNLRAYGSAVDNIPEPTSIALLASGLAAFCATRRKKERNTNKNI